MVMLAIKRRAKSAQGHSRRFWHVASCPVRGNPGNAVCRVLPIESIGLDMIQALEPGHRIMRYELMDFEWAAIRSFLSNKPRLPRR